MKKFAGKNLYEWHKQRKIMQQYQNTNESRDLKTKEHNESETKVKITNNLLINYFGSNTFLIFSWLLTDAADTFKFLWWF